MFSCSGQTLWKGAFQSWSPFQNPPEQTAHFREYSIPIREFSPAYNAVCRGGQFQKSVNRDFHSEKKTYLHQLRK